MSRFNRVALAALVVALAPRASSAADTTEPFDAGAGDVDFYVGLDGLGGAAADRALAGELMVGYGVLERFSMTLGVSLERTGELDTSASDVYVGLIGTPLETDHVDLDLLLTASSAGARPGDLGLTPAVELNVDGDAEMRSWGLYLRAGLPISSASDADTATRRLQLGLAMTAGAYVQLGADHQLLLEYDWAHDLRAAPDEDALEQGGFAFGYNVTLSDRFELINQLYVDVPQADAPVTLGVMSGFIVTLPGARSL